MWAHIERFDGGCIRVFDDGVEYGEPPSFAFAFEKVGEVIELKALVGRAPTPAEGRAMLKAARQQGWRVVRDRKSGLRRGLRDITRDDL